jgi:hypothetical protein
MEKQTVCSVDGCGKKYSAKGLCVNHYYRLRRRGSLLTLGERGLLAKQQKCTAAKCKNTQIAGGYCRTHYSKLYTSGTLERLVFGPEWRRKKSVPWVGSIGHIDPTRDTRPGKSGYYAVNIVNDIKQSTLNTGWRGRGEKRAKGWWALTQEQAYRLIVADCFYCGIKSDWPKGRNGIDRKVCSIGYTPDNCVTACWQCNAAKNTHSIEAFRAWLERAYRHFVQHQT